MNSENKIKVTVACGGKFHAFHLAEQLDKAGLLSNLYTGFYSKKQKFLERFRKDTEFINLEKIKTNLFLFLLGRILSNRALIRNCFDLDYYLNEQFDLWVSRQIGKCDLVVAWSGGALNTIRKAKSLGITSVVERGSSHILFQKEILEEEYEKYGVKKRPVSEKILNKELKEYEEADYISIPSNFVKQTFIDKRVPEGKLIHVPYGVDVISFKKIPKQDKKFRIIFAGSISLRKGIQYLLEAYSQLKLKNAELLLIGSISDEIKPLLAKYSDYYKHVTFISHNDLYKYLSQGSVFVLPSIEEGLAMIIPQAMACGLPIICTENTGGEDMVREGIDGYIIPIRDVAAIKTHLFSLYENQDLCKKMGQIAMERANEFTWEHYGKRLISAYAKIVNDMGTK